MNRKDYTVTLCMIVKDEEHIIHECLDSMAPYIDRYDITDTGSSDKTMDIIREWGEKNNIPGKVYEEPWRGFGKSRTDSLRNADRGGADFAWVIDADDRVQGNFKYPQQFGEEKHWSYALKIRRGDFEWWRGQILHEYAQCPEIEQKQGQVVRLDGDYSIDARTMGNRTLEFESPEGVEEVPGKEIWRMKYIKDAETILDCLTNPDNENYEPDNLRYLFYLAQSYFDGGDWKNAEEWYIKRAEKGGWEEEQWYSVLRCAMCMSNQEKDWQKIQDVFLQAWNMRPHRSEPLFHLARIHRMNGNPRLGYLFAKHACSIPFPHQDSLFVSRDVYDWQIFDELASTAWYGGDIEAGIAASNKLLSEKKYPESEHERILNNWKQYVHITEENEKKQKEAEAAHTKQKILADEEARHASLDRKEQNKKSQQKKQINKRRAKQQNAKKQKQRSRR
jgi:glycosyltransferase involved in cell wall biosynthesis